MKKFLVAGALALAFSVGAHAVPVSIDPLGFDGPIWTITTKDDGSTVVLDPTGKLIDLGTMYATAYTSWEMVLSDGVGSGETSLSVAALGSSGAFDAFTLVGQASYTGTGLSAIKVVKKGFSITGGRLNDDTDIDPNGFGDEGVDVTAAYLDNRRSGGKLDFYTQAAGSVEIAFKGIAIVGASPPPTEANMPEPASLALVGIAMVAAGLSRRRA